MTPAVNAPWSILRAAVVQQPPSKLVRSSADSVARVANEKASVTRTMDTSSLRRHVGDVTKPPSLSGAMRKAGIALIAVPDPFTGVPGVALLASSIVLKKNEPASVERLALETRKVLREIQSLRL